jgi:hypothetical protein
MRRLKPTSKRSRSGSIDRLKHNFFVFDTELKRSYYDEKGKPVFEPMPKNFVFGVLYGYNFVKVFHSVTEFRKEFKKKKYQKKYIFAHNCEFDLTVIYGNIYQKVDSKAIFNGKFITCRKDDVIFCDSFNIYPSSVQKIGEIVGLKKGETDKIYKGLLTKKNVTQQDIEYCTRDCEIVYNALLEIFENVGTIKMTIGSLAMYDFRNKFLKNELLFNDLVDEFFQSYYGGRTEAFIMGEGLYDVYDVNSLYPWVMKDIVFPDIRTLKKENFVSVEYLLYLIKRYEGLAKVTIVHQECYFGFIPYRSDKLLFPIGEFTTTVNFNELRFAIENSAIKIIHCEYVVYSNPIQSPFKDFVNINYDARVKTSNELEKMIIKSKMNNLYGKFGQRVKYTTEYFDMIPYEIISELEKANKFHEVKIFNPERNDCFLITENEKFKNSFFAIPTFASYITSEARITILKGLLSQQSGSVAYCDTDSLFIKKGTNFVGDVGKELGQYKKESKEVLEIRGLKNYVYMELQPLDSQMFYFDVKESIKGVNKNSVKIKEGVYINTQYFKTKESLRRSKEAGSKKIVIKELKHEYDKRVILPDNQTKPIKL